MPVPSNILTQVQTYNKSNLALLQNMHCFVATANKMYQNFQNLPANLGATVTFDAPPRFTTVNSLVASFEAAEQRINSLTVDQEVSTSYAFTAQNFIFNVEDYMEKFGRSAIAEIGAKIEEHVSSKILNHTYRFYGDGTSSINSYQQLATALAYFRTYGAVANVEAEAYLPDIAVPTIIGSGLSQFVIDRNEDIAMSWELGKFSNCKWYQTNRLPVHISGNIGNAAAAADRTLTVVSTNDPTGANITQIVCTTTDTTDANAIFENDLGAFVDGVSNRTNVRYLTWIGHSYSSAPCQIRITASAASSGGNVTINIFPGLSSVPGKNQNINTNIVAGMKIILQPSHRRGLITAGKPLYLAMPQLPQQVPYPTSNEIDPATGCSMRLTYGSVFGQNTMGNIHDAIYGATLVDEYAMAMLFPL